MPFDVAVSSAGLPVECGVVDESMETVGSEGVACNAGIMLLVGDHHPLLESSG